MIVWRGLIDLTTSILIRFEWKYEWLGPPIFEKREWFY